MWSIPAAGWNTLQKALDWANRQEDHAIERPILLRKGVDHEFSGNFVPFVAKKQNHYSHRTPIMNRLLPLPGQVKCGFGTNSVCPILEADGSKNTKIHKKYYRDRWMRCVVRPRPRLRLSTIHYSGRFTLRLIVSGKGASIRSGERWKGAVATDYSLLLEATLQYLRPGVGLRDSLVLPVQPLRVALPRHLPASPHRPPEPGRTPDRPVPGADGFRYSARVRI
ncbi:MAG: hypothetical protein RLZZ226_444 [Pseudomonadota bacterium]